MPPIEVGPTRAIGAVSAEIARKATGDTSTATASTATANIAARPAVETSEALDPGSAPIDLERVSQIRKAVENGEYPLVPARIADAMIAAGLLLRTAK